VGAAAISGSAALVRGLGRSAEELDRDAEEIVQDPAVLAYYLAKLEPTPPLTEGPFFPYDDMPSDRDNDLIVVGASTTPALGAVVHLAGRVLRPDGEPVRNATVQIWQTDSAGAYIHHGSAGHAGRDRNFQGYGAFETGKDGRYKFRTIRPVRYPGRTPHIHVAVDRKAQERFTTQVIDSSDPQSPRDSVLNSIRDPEKRKLVLRDFAPMEGKVESYVEFDVVLDDALRA
jgi:protocatechuate 3,4-dioxygenase beta subunit